MNLLAHALPHTVPVFSIGMFILDAVKGREFDFIPHLDRGRLVLLGVVYEDVHVPGIYLVCCDGKYKLMDRDQIKQGKCRHLQLVGGKPMTEIIGRVFFRGCLT